jgi:hypothetical protein
VGSDAGRPTLPAARPLGFALQPASLRFKGGPWGIRASPGAMAIFPPLTANEEAVLEVLASGAAGGYTAELIAERAGLGREQAERALRSLEARKPPFAIGESDGGTRWKPAKAIAALLG